VNSTPTIIGALIATVVVGALVALQPPINAELARRSSDLAAAFFSVSVSFLVLALIFVVFGDHSSLSQIRGTPLIYLTGGLFGALFVAVSLITVRTLGAGATIAALVSAQLIVAAILDHVGALGLQQISFSALRGIGVAALILGTVLVTIRS
jgi:transporter family-2 protein